MDQCELLSVSGDWMLWSINPTVPSLLGSCLYTVSCATGRLNLSCPPVKAHCLKWKSVFKQPLAHNKHLSEHCVQIWKYCVTSFYWRSFNDKHGGHTQYLVAGFFDIPIFKLKGTGVNQNKTRDVDGLYHNIIWVYNLLELQCYFEPAVNFLRQNY